MKLTRTKHILFVPAFLLIAVLACSQFSSMPETGQSEPTSTVAPSPTPTADPALEGILFTDGFADNSNNWHVGADADTETVIEDGKFKVRVLVPNDSFYWFTPPVSVSEVDISVDTEFTEGAPENIAYGFLCHFTDGDNYHRVRVAPDGTYAIDKSVNGEKAYLAEWTKSGVIKQGIGADNRIRTICSEGRLILYINDVLTADVADTSLSGGSFNLMVGAYANNLNDKNPVAVSFSNLIALEPQAWERPTESPLTDSFEDNHNNWDLFDENGNSAQIENGQLVMKVKDADTVYRVWPQLALSDVDMTFDVVIQEGTQANVSYGAACRYVNNDNHYSFHIDGDAYYTLKKKVNGMAETIVDWAASTAIQPGGGVTNRIRVVCSGSTLELYANDQLVISSQDASLTAGGFALQAGRFAIDDKPVTVAFDNVEVKYP
ncbi:hypothetical protein ANAEL_03587 [Anaerolineales bacterium]|nr:hypothetical protein ANAEL_03587 [Anaerolineales bacterium]